MHGHTQANMLQRQRSARSCGVCVLLLMRGQVNNANKEQFVTLLAQRRVMRGGVLEMKAMARVGHTHTQARVYGPLCGWPAHVCVCICVCSRCMCAGPDGGSTREATPHLHAAGGTPAYHPHTSIKPHATRCLPRVRSPTPVCVCVCAQLREVVSGPRSIDVGALKRHVVYDRGLKPSHPLAQVVSQHLMIANPLRHPHTSTHAHAHHPNARTHARTHAGVLGGRERVG